MSRAGPGRKRYPTLFSAIKIGQCEIRNRILSCAQVTHYAIDGHESRRDVAFHVAKARGGVGLTIVGNRPVHPTATMPLSRFVLGYGGEALISSQRQLTEAVHAAGAAIFAQLNHFGLNGVTSETLDDARVLLAPSAVKAPSSMEVPHVMELSDIEEVIQAWSHAASIMKEAGFDGVEIHLAHSYLAHQFLSPLWNKRTDEYGGSAAKRRRFAKELVAGVRRQVGEGYVVGVRVPVSEFMEGGLGVSDAVALAKELSATSGIDFINVTAGGTHNLHWAPGPSDIGDGWLLELVSELKSGIGNVPVFAVGGVKDARVAEEFLVAGRADMVAMTRAQIADPELIRKVEEGREDEIYHCIRCNQGCLGRALRGLNVGCTLNPPVGREAVFGRTQLSKRPARWIVVGGGPAGMKAAELLAVRGHKVTLFECESVLGGQVNLITRTPGRETFSWVTRDLGRILELRGVAIQLGVAATVEGIAELEPDGVVVATGAMPEPKGFSSCLPLQEVLPGWDLGKVRTVWDILGSADPPRGQRTIVLDDDGTRYAAGTAEVLLDLGNEVEVITPFASLFPATVHTLEQGLIYERLFKKGLQQRMHSWSKGVTEESVKVVNLYTGLEEEIQNIDIVVLATARAANDELYKALRSHLSKVVAIGDCVAPRRLDHAFYEGYLAGTERWSSEERYIMPGELERAAADLDFVHAQT